MDKKETIILIVTKDNPPFEELHEKLQGSDFSLIFLGETDKVLSLIKERLPEIVIIDLDTAHMDEIELLKEARKIDPQTEVIFIGDGPLRNTCIEAINLGAYDYITKPIDNSELANTIRNIHTKKLSRHEIGDLESTLVKKYEFEGMIGRCPQMLDIFSFIRRISKHPTTVLITGETGTGKELAARAIHNLSKRGAQKFVSCNCAALAESLLESELFGHVKGAFTGATQTKFGLFEYGSSGTIFLDEIGDISLATQTKLLRVLESKEIQRVGSNETIKVDVRIVSATNKDLESAVKHNLFRRDLYYRLNVVQICLPPIRERREDIPFLIHYFLNKFNERYDKTIKGISQPAKLILMNYEWPGNIRELEHVVEGAVSLSGKDFIAVTDLPQYIQKEAEINKKKRGGGMLTNLVSDDELPPLSEIEKRYILKIMEKTGGNKAKAAKILGLSRRSLYRKLEESEEAKKPA